MNTALLAPAILYTIASLIGLIGNAVVAYFSTKSGERGAFRHLNNVVKNLAITDFLYSLFGVPLMFYILGEVENGTIDQWEKTGERWKIYATILPSNVLLSYSCCFVAIIVLLRLLLITRPVSFKALHAKISRIGSIIVWTTPLFIFLVIFVMAVSIPFPPDPNVDVVSICLSTARHICYSAPILSTIILYIVLLVTLRRDTGFANSAGERMKSLSKMTRGIVICMIVCNVPYLAWKQYLQSVQSVPTKRSLSSTENAPSGTSHLLLIMKTLTNPIVYATTIPAFKELIKGLFSCKLGSKSEDTEDTTKTQIPMTQITKTPNDTEDTTSKTKIPNTKPEGHNGS